MTNDGAPTRRPLRAWQRMLSGRRLDLLDPSPMDVELSDIAHWLARVARWNGQTRGEHPFSVAQHAILVSEIAKAHHPALGPEGQLYAILHDAPEYVMGDIISPFKAVMGGNYKQVEARLLASIHIRFGLGAVPPPPLARLIKRADRDAAYFEAVHLAGFEQGEASGLFGEPLALVLRGFTLEQLIHPWPTPEAQKRFLAVVASIIAQR